MKTLPQSHHTMAKRGPVVTSRSGWVPTTRVAHDGASTEVAVRTTTEVHVAHVQSSSTLMREAGGALSTLTLDTVRLSGRCVIGAMGLAFWVLARSAECVAAILVATERILGGSRQRPPLLYWIEHPREPESTALARLGHDHGEAN